MSIYSEIIPVFPLGGSILLPQAILPLHIFEPRYRQMVEHAMSEESLIGMIQPVSSASEELHQVGCLGKIEEFQKLPNENYLIQLHGVIRFQLLHEVETDTLFRQFRVSYQDFEVDLKEPQLPEDPERLSQAFQNYTEKKQLQIEWEKIKSIPLHFLVNILCMNLDFGNLEKQALLESPDLVNRTENLITLMEMAVAEEFHGDDLSNQIN